jgi:thioredoxin-related protein
VINFLLKTIITIVLLQTSLLSQEINIDKIHLRTKTSNKNTIIYLHRIGCSYCNSMQEFTLEVDDVAEYLQEHYEVIHINVSVKDSITYKGCKSGGGCLAKKVG